MRLKTLLTAILAVLLAGSTAITLGDDGKIERHPVTSPPGQSSDPEPIAEHAFIQYLNFYVPAQKSDGTLLSETTVNGGIDYYNIDEVYVETAVNAKPLIGFALYGPVISFDDFSTSGFPGHGRRDAWAMVSLDDGETWKKTNLSKSGGDSSFITSTPIPDPAVPFVEFEVNSETPTIIAAAYLATKDTLTVNGAEVPGKATVEIRNARTFEVIGTARAKQKGTFTFTVRKPETVPCFVQAGFSDSDTWGGYHKVSGAPEDCIGTGSENMITDYPGDVTNGVHAMAGNKIIAAWQSKFCRGGSPVWGDTFIIDRFEAVVTHLGVDYPGFDPTADLYLTDLFKVAGSQDSTDYREQEEYPGEYDDVGEVPHSCLWTARGVLRKYVGTDDDLAGTTEVVWFNRERLTSGRRDVNRIEASCVANAGCTVSWQEDPDGLRPGEGGGPGTGWSGATTHSKTDVWFSFIRWTDFDVVYDEANLVLIPLDGLDLDLFGTRRPKPGIPMMVPVRLSNNDRCQIEYDLDEEENEVHYCDDATAYLYGIKNQCATTVTTDNTGAELCVADTDGDGYGDLPNIANTAASRPRLSLQPRDSDADGITDDAWVIVYAEEDKGMGAYGFPSDVEWNGNLTSTAVSCGEHDASKTDTCIQADIGKNILWYTFAMGTPQTSAGLGDDFGLVNNLVAQGAQLNQPEVNWHTGTFFPPLDTADMWGFGAYDYLIFNTEIARRSSMMAQSIGKASASTSKLVALPLWKQGAMNKGGPADIMARRFVATIIDQANANPYDVANMECAWYDGEGNVEDGLILFDPDDDYNPYYPKGLCTAPAINLSGRTPYECDADGTSQADGTCNAENLTCTFTVYGQLCIPATVTDGSPDDPLYRPGLDKMLSWYECPGANGAYTGTRTDLPACGDTGAPSAVLASNLDDQSWYNPVDIAKGHRGFLDGDFVQMLYAWSPNYKQNTVGHDHYDLYVRRSFDGGLTWGTLPGSFLASNGETYNGDGTVTCETLRDGISSQEHNHICTTYLAGDPEQSRNVSQLQSMKFTILDPRYTPTGTNLGAGMPYEIDRPLWAEDLDWLIFDPIDPTDIRDPSRFFVVYETGDNTTTAYGEAEPLNLYYGRGVMFGDHYQVWAEDKPALTLDICYPNTTYDVENAAWAAGLGFCNEFDDLEGKKDDESGEASITASAGGDFLYAVWAQEDFVEHEFEEGDAIFRRVWYLDDYFPVEKAWSLPGAGD